MTTVLIADHTPLMRDAIGRALEHIGQVKVVGEADEVGSLLTIARKSHPDVVVVDVELPGFEIPRTIREVFDAGHQPKILIFTLRGEPQVVRRVMREGVSGYILKGINMSGFQEAFRTLLMGERVIDQAIEPCLALSSSTSGAAKPPRGDQGTGELTDRDLELVHWLADNISNVEIARRLGVSERTAKGYVSSVFEKLGVSSRLEAVVIAARSGLLRL